MNNIFKKTNAYWVRYSRYAYMKDDDGELYLMPASDSTPSVYDPMKEPESLVVDALNVGRLAMKRDDSHQMMDAVLGFVNKYGLLGFMTALPTTPEFLSYDMVYLPKNHFIKTESLSTQDYMVYYFPSNRLDIYKNRDKSQWDIDIANQSNEVTAVALTYANEPMAVSLSLMPIYAERYDWLVTQFRDWAYMLVSSTLFYEDANDTDDFTRELYRQGVAAFGSKAPTYHISLNDDKPQITWDFYSLLLTIQTLFGFALTDESRPLRICRHCNKAFISNHPKSAYCSQQCKNQHNVYRNRKKQDTD